MPKRSLTLCICFAAFVLVLAGGPLQAQTLLFNPAPVPLVVSPNTSVRPAPAAATVPPLAMAPPMAMTAQTLPIACGTAGSQPAPIAALVVALKCDPDLIFEYVYNNIEFDPLYGSIKGPLGTLLDRRGDDADQAMLLVTLLNAAGYTQAQYAWAIVRLTGAQLSNWLAVPNDANAIQALLNDGFIPTLDFTPNTDGTLNYIDMGHFVVSLQLNNTTYYFDPSFKQHALTAGIANLDGALGYSRSQFLSDIGGTVNSVSISSLNRTALRGDLNSYANNLVSYLNGANRTASVGNVIGGRSILRLAGSPIRQTTFPNLSPASGAVQTFSTFPVDCPSGTVATECRTYITITMPSAPSSLAIKLYTDQVYGHRITVFSTPSGSNFVPTLLIDGAVPSCVGAGTCTNVGPATTGGTTWPIPITAVEANTNPNVVTSCGAGITACKTLNVAAGGSFLISTGAGVAGHGMPEYHRQLLAQARAAGSADTSELVLGESLAVLGYTWLAETAASRQMTDQFAGTTTLFYFGVGIAGQANILQLGYQGPYVDLPLNLINIVPQVSNGPTTTVGGFSYSTAVLAAFFADAETLSAFESGVLEQTQAPVAGMTAASTIKIIDANMTAGYTGALLTTFFADGTTQSGQSTYASAICPNLKNYSSTDLSAVSTAVFGQSHAANCTLPTSFTPGQQVLLPQNGQLAAGLWHGAGYTEISPMANGAISAVQKISGGMSGGFSGADIVDPTPNFQETLPPSASAGTLPFWLNTIPDFVDPKSLEPVDAVTGAYIYQNDDLTTGSGRFPYALSFSRSYLSSSGTYLTTTAADNGIGNGWAHTYSANVQVQSDPYVGMGASSSPAIPAATSIAALAVMNDLLSVTPTAQTMTVSSMVARYFTDQLNGNVAMVVQPNTTEEFVALPHADGSTAFAYNPPPGSAVQFNQLAAGQFVYRGKDAVALNFGPTPAGALQSWVFPNGMTVSLSYAGSQLAKVTNNLGRSLTLSYSGNDITGVTDDTGRSVHYGYDGHHNLASFADPLANTTTYGYDASGIYDTFAHLTQVFYPFQPSNPYVTNWYDPLGRVVQQANANGSASKFYFAGSRSELIDAVGNRNVTYQTDRGKVLSNAYVLSLSFGDVFNDTAQQNGAVNVTTNQYDGLDRLTLTRLPEGGTTAVTYATAVNPWANNVASVTRTAKPGSPLPPLTTSLLYDPIYNKPVQVTDPLGLISTSSYDPATGNLLSTVADAGGVGHANATASFTYDGHGSVASATDPRGVVSTFSHDSFENLIKQVADSGGSGHLNTTTLFGYDPLGNVVSRTDANGNTTTMSYDAARRVLTTMAPAPFNTGAALVTSANSYDASGHLLSVTRTNGASRVVTSMIYTATGKVASATDPNGNTTTNSYDADDRLVSVTDPLSRVTRFAYDAVSRRISVSNPAIQATPLQQQSYTPDGLVASLTDANGNATSFTPDGFDRLSTTTYPDSSTEALAYDTDGNVLTRKTRAGATITFSYDTLNRLTTKTAPSEPTVSYAYDIASHVIGISDNSAAVTAPAASASYAATYAYDQMNRPTNVSWSPASAQTPPTASSAASFGYAYDATNRRIGQSASDNGWWSYPAAATSVGYAANNLNQYTTVGAVSPSYDGNGNLTTDGTFTYGYDAENRLVSATGSALAASYAYDAQGRRKSKTVNGTTTLFVTDADNREVLEYDGVTGAIGNWYSFAPTGSFGPDAVLNQMSGAGTTRQTLIPDVQGSIAGTLDATSGTLTKIGYQAYGENAGQTTGTYRYTGRRLDAETAGSTAQPSGLYYYRAREYSPAWGRFMQVDALGKGSDSYAEMANLYSYVKDDPVNNLDPSGLWSLDVNAVVFGFSFGIGDQSAQAFGTLRFGYTGGGVTYSPTADIPIGPSGVYPGNCTYCTVNSIYWETTKGNLGLTIGPVDVTVFQYQGTTLVDEFGKSGEVVNAANMPGSGLTFDPDISISPFGSSDKSSSGKIGLGSDAQLYYEFGWTFPWSSSQTPAVPSASSAPAFGVTASVPYTESANIGSANPGSANLPVGGAQK